MTDTHAVTFYDRERQVEDAVTDHIQDGLDRGERVVVIVSSNHASGVERCALERGLRLDRARAEGRLVVLDAAKTLASFMVGGAPDPQLFMWSVGGVIMDAGADGTPVRAFGEMVALLWEQGNVAAALRLEELWNELAVTQTFSLLCAYPRSALEAAPLGDVSQVCALHTDVRADYADPGPGAGVGAAESAVFVAVPQSVAAARRFVTQVLESWGRRELLADAALLASELATNAVRHAASPFRTDVERDGAAVRISVTDLAPGRIVATTADFDDLNGRGIAIVQAVADHWGCDEAPGGKVVWAELHVDTPA